MPELSDSFTRSTLTYDDLSDAQKERCDRLWDKICDAIRGEVEEDGPAETAFYDACVLNSKIQPRS